MGWDASRVTAALPSGVGFLGGALIWKGTVFVDDQEMHQVHGLTTAASLWLSAAIGVGVGGALYSVTIYAVRTNNIVCFIVLCFRFSNICVWLFGSGIMQTVLVILVLRYGPKVYNNPNDDDDEQEEEEGDENDEEEEEGDSEEDEQNNAAKNDITNGCRDATIDETVVEQPITDVELTIAKPKPHLPRRKSYGAFEEQIPRRKSRSDLADLSTSASHPLSASTRSRRSFANFLEEVNPNGTMTRNRRSSANIPTYLG